MIQATNKVDVNGVVRRFLEASKISFASMNAATSLTGMLYGGITPIGLPADWPILLLNSLPARSASSPIMQNRKKLTSINFPVAKL